MPELTDRQQEILDFIRDSIVKRWCSPTVREICEEFGIRSPQGVTCHLDALKKKGCIDWEPLTARSIRLIGYRLKIVPE